MIRAPLLHRDDVDRILGKVRAAAPQMKILLVANLRDQVPRDDETQKAQVAARALDATKAAERLELFQSADFNVELIPGEEEFARRCGDPSFIADMRKSRALVYHVGPERTGEGSRSFVPGLVLRKGLTMIGSPPDARGFSWRKPQIAWLLKGVGVRVPETWVRSAETGWGPNGRPKASRSQRNDSRYFVKSFREAFSVGVDDASLVDGEDGLEAVCDAKIAEIGQPVTVQRYIEGRELAVPIFGCGPYFVPSVVEVFSRDIDGSALPFQTWRCNSGRGSIAYGEVGDARLERNIVANAVKAMAAIGLEDIARFDFRVDAQGHTYLFDVGEVPGLGPKGAMATAMQMAGFQNADLARLLVGMTLDRTERRALTLGAAQEMRQNWSDVA